jgi:hypothetical protein
MSLGHSLKGKPMAQTKAVRGVATSIWSEAGKTMVRYHNTVVATFDESTITLDTGGWDTPTTKLRMNQTANQFDLRFSVFQRKHKWYVYRPGLSDPIPFVGTRLTLPRFV